MLSLARRVQRSALNPCSHIQLSISIQHRYARTDGGSSPNRRRSKFSPASMLKKTEEVKSEWWIVDGEMHEIGDNIPPRERFVIARENIPNKRRKQLREQFMRRTRLVLKESVSVLCPPYLLWGFPSQLFFSPIDLGFRWRKLLWTIN